MSTLAGAIALGSMTGIAVHAQSIVPDGRTQTTLQTSGSVTDVRTATVQGAVGYNSFDRFNVDAGKVVNLHLPGGTDHLLNLVHNQRTTIDGMLNALKGGQIGGHVLIANPHGIVVGSQGVVNVGALSLVTPTGAFIDDFFEPGGAPSAAATSALLDGSAPIASDAVVSVEGVVNTVDDLRVDAGSIDIAGVIGTGRRFAGSAVDFSDVVNIGNLSSVTIAESTAGDIELRATGDIDITGWVLRGHGPDDVLPGRIEVVAGGDISMDILPTGAQDGSAIDTSFLVIGIGNLPTGEQGGITAIDASISIVSGGDLAVRNVATHGDVAVRSSGGDVHLSSVGSHDGDVSVHAAGSVFDSPEEWGGCGDACELSYRPSRTDVYGHEVSIEATNGSIGELANGFHLEVTTQVGLHATASTGAYFTVLGDEGVIEHVRVEQGDVVLLAHRDSLRIGLVEAPVGEVRLLAEEGIEDANANNATNVVARRVTLVSLSAIGTLGDPLEIDTDAGVAGGLWAEATRDIYVTEVSGDLRVADRVASAEGDVYLEALAGDLIVADVYANRGLVGLAAAGSIRTGVDTVVEADNVVLNSGGSVGSEGTPLLLAMPELVPVEIGGSSSAVALAGFIDTFFGPCCSPDDPPPELEVEFRHVPRAPLPPHGLGVEGTARDGIYLHEASGGLVIQNLESTHGDIGIRIDDGDLWIDRLTAAGSLEVRVDGSIVENGDDAGFDISAGDITLFASGVIGLPSNLLEIDSQPSSGGSIVNFNTLLTGSSGLSNTGVRSPAGGTLILNAGSSVIFDAISVPIDISNFGTARGVVVVATGHIESGGETVGTFVVVVSAQGELLASDFVVEPETAAATRPVRMRATPQPEAPGRQVLLEQVAADIRRVNQEVAVLFASPPTGSLPAGGNAAFGASVSASLAAPFSDTPLDTGFGAFDAPGIVPVQPLGQPAEPLLTIAE